MIAFINQPRTTYGVESICQQLPIAPSTYYWPQERRVGPTRRSPRALPDDELCAAIRRIWDDNYQVSGPRKVWEQLKRDGVVVARCTVRRLMRGMGLQGAVRGRAWVTTTPPAPAAEGPADLVERNFTTTHPNRQRRCS